MNSTLAKENEAQYLFRNLLFVILNMFLEAYLENK